MAYLIEPSWGGEFVVIRVDVDHQHIARVDALEGSGVAVSRLAAGRDELVADVPLGVQSDATWEAPFCARCSCTARDRLYLRSRRRSGDYESLARWM
jgi:hypothetical protein